MKDIINIAQLTLAILLATAVLLQSRGSGVGTVFGGGGEIYRTKRGVEKSLFFLTIIISALFLGVSLINAIIF